MGRFLARNLLELMPEGAAKTGLNGRRLETRW
jgi:hypothetical protein